MAAISMLIVCHVAAPIVIARGVSAVGSTAVSPNAIPASVSNSITELPTASDANTAGQDIGERRTRSGDGAISTAMTVPFLSLQTLLPQTFAAAGTRST